VVQRQPAKKAGWSEPDPNPDPETGFSWNKEMQLKGTIRRYPIQDLTEGYQSETKGGASGSLTRESAKGRAILLVSSGFNPKAPATILLHLHGYAETRKRPYAGWRQHKRTGKVRDVELDRVAQQIEAAGDPQIIGLLPQGGEKSQFSSKKHPYDTFAADPYIDQVLEELVKVGAFTTVPKERKVVLSAHSGGGHTVRSMLESQNKQRQRRPTTGLAALPAGLAEVSLFEAINNDTELDTVKRWVTGKLDDLLAVLTDSARSTADKDKELAATPKFRAYYAVGGFRNYEDRHKKLYVAIREWFRNNGTALGPYAEKLWPLFQVVPVSGLGENAGKRHEALVRGHRLEDAGAPAAGTLTDALKSMKQPTASKPVPIPYSTPGVQAGAITSSRLGAFGDQDETAFRRAVFDEQRRRALADPDKEYYPGVVEDDLGWVEGRRIHEVAADQAQALVDSARADLAAARQARDRRALRCRSIGVGSAYRSLGDDFVAWKETFQKHYRNTSSARAALPGGSHGSRAVGLLAGILGGVKAIPGFSNHTKGLAIDFVTHQDGQDLGANSDATHRRAWRNSWFHHWLVDNAVRFDFRPLASEEWHWDHKGGLPGAASDAAAGMPASGGGASPTTGAPPQPQPALARTASITWGPATTAPAARLDRSPGPSEVTIRFGSRAKQSAVAASSLTVLQDVLRASGLRSATITSTARSAADQARAMYQNLVGRGRGQGVSAQRRLYGPAGDSVIDTFVELRDQGKSPAEIKTGMKDKIIEVGPSRVSRHCGDPNILNVFDVGPASVGNSDAQEEFVDAARAEEGSRITKFIPYPQDPGHHFEITPG
jgi:hypothetical protein